ncbi:hypothetical protein [Halioxenophilus sp. WMMB6]|nr:hypothetical protein [Halioxenophilus sp. WMMB6]
MISKLMHRRAIAPLEKENLAQLKSISQKIAGYQPCWREDIKPARQEQFF